MVDAVIDSAIKESVADTNLKTVGETAAFYAAQGMADSVANQRRANQLADMTIADKIAHSKRMDILAEGQVANAIGGIGDNINGPTVTEAVADQKVLTGNDLAQGLIQINAALAQQKSEIDALVAVMQQLVKTSQSTPPETAVPVPK